MRLDLSLLPVEHESAGWGFSHTILDVPVGASDIWEALAGRPRVPLPTDLNTFYARHPSGDPCYGKTATDRYGSPLEAVSAWTLVDAFNTSDVLSELLDAPRMAAVVAYLRELPADTKIALMWR